MYRLICPLPNRRNIYIKIYATNSIFRSAASEELVINDNPYRRPVRPEDLGFIDFSRPIARSKAMELSSLTAHRMLINIYDTERLYLPEHPTESKWEDFNHSSYSLPP